ncbi:MAG: glucuronate isomerase, partial [Bdellovibrionales bacterium]|nr:glucuronate isomerase [Bdellovibrionales bacterium]
KWQSYMLQWLCEKNAEKGFVQYIHQGPRRDQNSRLFKKYGADIGGDGPGENLDGGSMIKLLNALDSKIVPSSLDGTGLAKTVIFPLRSEDFEVVLNGTRSFLGNSAGIASKLQLGTPWWFNDLKEVIGKVMHELNIRGSLGNWLGMLSDARSLPSVIARHALFRAVLSAKLVEEFPRAEPESLVELAEKICHLNAKEFLRLNRSAPNE